jgi:hypothetical protein
MGSKITAIVVLLITLGMLGGGGYYMMQYLAQQPKKINSYQDIMLGDSKDQVFYALGKPSRVLIPNKEQDAPEMILGKESLEKNPDHEKGYHHWQYLSAKTVTDVLFDPESKKTVTIGCSKLSAQPAFVSEPPPELTPPPAKGKKVAMAPPVPVVPPPPPPLTPTEAANAPAVEPTPPSAGVSPGGVAPAPAGDAPAGDAPAEGTAPPVDGGADACNINGVKIGDTEKEVLKRLGRPKKEAYDGIYKTISYPSLNLSIKMEKRIVIYIMAVKEVLPKSTEPVEGDEGKAAKEK